MTWYDSALDMLAAQPVCGYLPEQTGDAEPTALACLALAGAGRTEASLEAANWLKHSQREDGSVSVRRELDQPRWPTALALLAWLAQEDRGAKFEGSISSAIAFAKSIRGRPVPPSPALGHDSTLVGWPWVDGTHSWIEPTAFHVLALKAAGLRDDERTREAAALLIDRQLPEGGCNYGNTFVLGQKLLPHTQPTGIAVLALANEPDPSGAIDRTLSYLEEELSPRITTASLCWGILGLSAHGRKIPEADSWLKRAYERAHKRRKGLHLFALLCLAAQGRDAMIVQLPSTNGM